ncbi:unnamed protein product [Gadus morhua 'NCC']
MEHSRSRAPPSGPGGAWTVVSSFSSGPGGAWTVVVSSCSNGPGRGGGERESWFRAAWDTEGCNVQAVNTSFITSSTLASVRPLHRAEERRGGLVRSGTSCRVLFVDVQAVFNGVHAQSSGPVPVVTYISRVSGSCVSGGAERSTRAGEETWTPDANGRRRKPPGLAPL